MEVIMASEDITFCMSDYVDIKMNLQIDSQMLDIL